MEKLILHNIAGDRSDVTTLKKIRYANFLQRNQREQEIKKEKEIEREIMMRKKRDTNDNDLLNQIFPEPQPEPEPVLSKKLKRDYILFDRVDDMGNKYRYGVFAVFSSFVRLDENGEYLDPTKASNVYDITRVLTVKTLITPSTFGSNSIGEPKYVEHDPVIELLETDEDPTSFIDQVFEYNNGRARPFGLTKNTQKIVERDDLEDVVDPMGTPFAIESAISENQMFYDRHILDLFYSIVNMNYVSNTRYELLMQTIITMLGI